ncbi:MAG: hypothetical protein ACRDNY_05390 [Gaiellaceae bacterium]
MADPSETTQVSLDPADPLQAELLDVVRALSVQVGGLQAEVQSLRAQRRTLPLSDGDAPGWEESTPARRESSTWMRSLENPGRRTPAAPRLLLEILFLVAVAVGAALADLDAPVVVALMALAWGLVAVAEWFAAQTARHRAAAGQAPLAGIGAVFAEDPSWFAPPVERPALEAIEDTGDGFDTEDGLEDTAGDEDTGPKLPPPSSH